MTTLIKIALLASLAFPGIFLTATQKRVVEEPALSTSQPPLPKKQKARLPPASSDPYESYAAKYAKKYKVKMAIVLGVLKVENGGNFKGSATRVSSAGAIGPMQLEPVTARYMAVNPWNPRENIKGGVKYLAYLLGRFGSEWLALEAYNAGPTAVDAGQVPEEAVNYAGRVLRSTGSA